CFVRRSLGPFQLSPPRPAPAPHLIDREVPGHPPDPGRERHVSRFVLLDRLEELGEDRLGYVLGLELVADDSANVSVDRTRVTDVQIANRLTVSSFGSVHGCLEPRSLGTGLAIRRALTEWGPGVHRRSLLVVDIVERAFAVDMAPGIGRRC